jgi:hypothetical protein
MIDKVIEIIKLFSPKYYDRITKIIILAGIGLLSKPLWVDILNIFLYKFSFNLIGENDWIIGLTLIVLALIYNTIQSFLHLKYNHESKPAFQNITNKTLSSYGNLCQEIFPLIKDNEYIFKSTGPNSNMGTLEPLRTDFTLWRRLRRDVILPNNNAIKKLIEENRALIPAKHNELFNKMILHIEAFNEHIINPDFDYSAFQFPEGFAEIVTKTSFETAKENKELKKKVKWISRKLKTAYISNWIIFGSIVLTPEKANDVDIAVFLNDSIDFEKANEKLMQLKFDFKLKFRRDLHMSIFDSKSLSAFKKFSKNNLQKIEKKNG